MNFEFANSLSGYIETLYFINKNIIKLSGRDAFYYDNSEKLVLDIMQDIPRIIPYKYDKKSNKLILNDKDGLLEYQNELIFLKKEYDEILEMNYDIIDKIRKIRNKYEHKMHDIKYLSSISGGVSLLSFDFIVDGGSIKVKTEELIKLIKAVNNLFKKLVEEIKVWANANNKTNYKYFQKLDRFEFTEFNEIYDSNLLMKVGKVLNDF